MPKNLYLVRHAEAAAREGRQDDKLRELTQNGIKNSLHLGAWFADQNISFDLLVSSSALRAEQTADLIAESMKIDYPKILTEDVLYEASVRQFLDYINDIEDSYSHVLITGHNPAISYLAEYLTKADIGTMPPGTVACIRFDGNAWQQLSENTAQMVHFLTPENFVKY